MDTHIYTQLNRSWYESEEEEICFKKLLIKHKKKEYEREIRKSDKLVSTD
jgi:hypothetical protein